MTQETTQEKRNYCLRMAAAIVVAIILHVPFLLVKARNGNAQNQQNDQFVNHSPRAFLFPPRNAKNLDKYILAIYEWADFDDPTVIIHPNPDYGFTKFIPKTPPQEVIPLPEVEPPRTEKSFPDIPDKNLETKARSTAENIQASWNKDTHLNLPAPQRIVRPRGVFWTTEYGSKLINPPKLDEEKQNLALLKGVPKSVTKIEVDPNPNLPLKRIILRESCGNKDLDLLAVEAVRNALENAGDKPLLPGFSPTQPVTLVVDWRL